MKTQNVYLDNASTTAIDMRVLAAMEPYYREIFGNPSSLHSHGREAGKAVDDARANIATVLGAMPEELIFTASGTEANNLALKGYAFANRVKGKHIIISAIEHSSVVNTCKWLESQGFDVSLLAVDSDGIVGIEQLESLARSDTILVSVMHVNNEIGVIEPIDKIGIWCREHDICFHTDACQSFGKIPFDVESFPVDMASLNSHKIHGPKGIGALYVRRGVNLMPWQHGGGQENGRRGATENVPGIVGFGQSAIICADNMSQEIKRLTALRDNAIEYILTRIPGAYLNGSRWLRVPHIINIGFYGFEGRAAGLRDALDAMGFAVSIGSACGDNHTGSRVLTAIGRSPVEAIGALRVSLGRFTTEEDMAYFLKTLPESMKNARNVLPQGRF